MKIKEKIITALVYLKNRKKRETISQAKQFKGSNAVEIGGPSKIFGLKSFFPVYLYANSVDGVNFSDSTIWEGHIQKGRTYRYIPSKEPGLQIIDEADELNQINDNVYDSLISSHCLEHIANPMKALKNWIRVVKPKGKLCVVVPFKESMFDHKRPFTSFEHLLNDYKNHIGEDDTTHFVESIELTDLSDPVMKNISKEEFIQRTHHNFQNRCVHHHVFNKDVLAEMFLHFGCKILYNSIYHNSQLLVIAQKP